MKHMGYQDKPLANITEDLFNVEVYVNALCSFIKSCETPMTISIQGDWGSGKTSMMNMMRANMQGAIWPIWFNTWQFSQFDMGNSLVFSMMDVLLKGLDCEKDKREKILNGIVGFGKKVVKVATDTAVGGAAADTVSVLMEGNSDKDFASEIMELKDKFQKAVDDKLVKEKKDRVVVFVDDLDRLQPTKAVELLEVLKLYLDCEKCVFVLAVDYEVVTLGIRQKFGNDVSEEKGRSFFDKIIQLPFKMPVANYDIHKYVKRMMERINVGTDEDEVTLFFNLIKTSVGFNPRSMKRLFNTYELLDIVTESTVKNVDDFVRKRVLFAIICTQMCFEKLYLYLTSTRIDEDTFTAFQEDESLDGALREMYGLESDDFNKELERIKSFMPYFIEALQVDEDKTLSEEELNNFRVILRSSVVTSVNSSVEESSSDSKEWDYRKRNKNIVKEAADMLTQIGKFNTWMPRKERPGVKLSDISGWYVWETAAGFSCSLEYYLSRISEYIIGVALFVSLSHGKGQEETFFKTLGSNPLKLGISPQREDWGRYLYINVLRINANDESAPEQIASVTKNAYASVNETIEQYQKKQIQEG